MAVRITWVRDFKEVLLHFSKLRNALCSQFERRYAASTVSGFSKLKYGLAIFNCVQNVKIKIIQLSRCVLLKDKAIQSFFRG